MLNRERGHPRRIRAQRHFDAHRLSKLWAYDLGQIGKGPIADQMALLGLEDKRHPLPLPGHHRVDRQLAQPTTNPGAGDELGPGVAAVDQQGGWDQSRNLLPLLRLGFALQLIPVDGLHQGGR
ncbi:hypothetical protein D3C78_1128700 [compost metagenome]